MSIDQIIIIALLVASVAFLLYFIIKSLMSPKKIEGIQKLLKQGKNSQAIKLAKTIIAKDPRDFKAHFYLGKAYLAENKPELALMEYKIVNQTAIFDSSFSEVEFRKLIAQLYCKYNQVEEALKEYILLTKLEPNNPDNFFNAGKLYDQKNRSDQSIIYYQKTIELNKKHVKAHAALGLLLYKSKQYGEAKKEIDLAIKLSPDVFSSYYYLGKILKESKDYPAAVNAFEKALRDPEFKQRALIERGACYMAANNIEKAIYEFDRAINAAQEESGNETLYARYFLAACYEKNRQIELAIEQWEKIYLKNHTFKDVPTKLSQYKDIESNDNMKEYITCNSEKYASICKNIALTGFNLEITSVENTKNGCNCIATEKREEGWMNVRQQIYYLMFFRDPDTLEDDILRKVAELMKSKNYFKCIVFTSSSFTRSCYDFAENRPIELIGKEKLEQILSKCFK